MDKQGLRCFIALTLPDRICQYLHQIQTQVRQASGIKATYPKPENFHLTFRFFYRISLDEVQAVKTSMDLVMQTFQESDAKAPLRFYRLGTFPKNQHRSKVLWAGVEDPSQILLRIHNRLFQSLPHTGVSHKTLSFFPHVTLARFKQSPSRKAILRIFETGGSLRSPQFFVHGIELFNSRLTPQGAIYTLLHTSGLNH